MTNTIHSDLIRGHINTIILKTLYEGDKYGYDIVRAIEQKSNGQYKMKQPTLYSCLKRLENQGLVTAYWGARSNGGRRRYYALTETGTQEFLKDQADWAYSKNLIDKLITSDSLDLDAITRELDEESEKETASDIEQENLFEEKLEEEKAEEVAESPALSNISPISMHEDMPKEEHISSSELNSVESIKFVDTTAIMNTLINNQLDAASDASYVDKILAEKYTPKSAPSTFNYFKDFEEETVSEDDDSQDNNILPQSPIPSFLQSNLSAKDNTDAVVEEENNISYTSPENILDRINQKYDDLRIKSEATAKTSQSALSKMTPPALKLSDVLSTYDVERQNLEKSRSLNEKSADNMDKSNIFISYDSLSSAEIDEKKTYIAREYKNILSSLVKNKLADFKTTQPLVKTAAETIIPAPIAVDKDTNREIPFPDAETEPLFKPFEGDEYEVSPIEALTRDRDVNKKLNKLTNSIRELGDNVKIRTHSNDSTKEYNNEYYYYSNKLMLVHYAILFGVMMLEVIFSFLFIRVGLNLKAKYDIMTYVLGILVAVAFPFFAFMANLYNPKKKKRISFNFKSSLIVRLFILAQSLLIVYFVNVILKMPLSFSREYLATLLLPALLVTNIPLSALLFNFLYKTKKYSVEI